MQLIVVVVGGSHLRTNDTIMELASHRQSTVGKSMFTRISRERTRLGHSSYSGKWCMVFTTGFLGLEILKGTARNHGGNLWDFCARISTENCQKPWQISQGVLETRSPWEFWNSSPGLVSLCLAKCTWLGKESPKVL